MHFKCNRKSQQYRDNNNELEIRSLYFSPQIRILGIYDSLHVSLIAASIAIMWKCVYTKNRSTHKKRVVAQIKHPLHDDMVATLLDITVSPSLYAVFSPHGYIHDDCVSWWDFPHRAIKAQSLPLTTISRFRPVFWARKVYPDDASCCWVSWWCNAAWDTQAQAVELIRVYCPPCTHCIIQLGGSWKLHMCIGGIPIRPCAYF